MVVEWLRFSCALGVLTWVSLCVVLLGGFGFDFVCIWVLVVGMWVLCFELGLTFECGVLIANSVAHYTRAYVVRILFVIVYLI